VLEVLYHHDKFGGTRISATAERAKTFSFFVCFSVCLLVCLSVMLLNDGVSAEIVLILPFLAP